MATFIYPGQTIGIIGAGMRAYWLALTARAMGFHIAVLAARPTDPALQVADYQFIGSLASAQDLAKLGEVSNCTILMDENADDELLQKYAQHHYFPQKAAILSITQDRYLEKVFLNDHNINIAPYTTVLNVQDVYDAVDSIGYPCIIKPIQKGLGKERQHVIYCADDIPGSAPYLQHGSYIMESWIPCEKELAVVVAKDQDGSLTTYPVIESHYQDQELAASVIKARIAPEVGDEVRRIARQIGNAIDYCGVFSVEFFLTSADTIYVKSVIPGPLDAGDVFSETMDFSQYEMHLRSLCCWPLPKPHLLKEGIMARIQQQQISASFTQIQIKPDWHFHYYPLDGPISDETAIGHVTIVGQDLRKLANQVNATDLWNV
ncbi:ATP-grasp domain-containing protein [Lactobacillus selangorensis]|uniref:ATP-grasp domain-containing protein n=1 Tax=Lactobacillus selangorensis TaxID=81857 RepID=UPI00070C5D6C|nr:ATP-grasp domain-containing protein [Lactobacillus selangorensis]